MIRRCIVVALAIGLFWVNPIKTLSWDGDTYISSEYQEYCVEIGEMYGICPELLMAIIEHESSGRADAVNGNHYGLMQVSSYWHSDRMDTLGVTDLFDPYSNILVATDYLMELAEQYEDVGTVLMVYHGESNAVKKAEQGNLSKYARSILERSEDLEKLHE